jgi:hypothetical protein
LWVPCSLADGSRGSRAHHRSPPAPAEHDVSAAQGPGTLSQARRHAPRPEAPGQWTLGGQPPAGSRTAAPAAAGQLPHSALARQPALTRCACGRPWCQPPAGRQRAPGSRSCHVVPCTPGPCPRRTFWWKRSRLGRRWSRSLTWAWAGPSASPSRATRTRWGARLAGGSRGAGGSLAGRRRGAGGRPRPC